MRKEHLDNIRNYIVDNIIRNPDYLFSDEIRGKEDDDIDLLTVIASLYEELHHEVTGEDYNYMWHFANKYGAYVDDKLFIDLKKGAEDTETWYGYHVQITAPKGTFKKMFEENEDNEGGD